MILNIKLIPETWIVAPVASKKQLQAYVDKGWIGKEDGSHLDRCFPRNCDGKPFIFRMWLRSPIRKIVDEWIEAQKRRVEECRAKKDELRKAEDKLKELENLRTKS